MPIVPPLYRNEETGHVEGHNLLFLGQRGSGKTFVMTAALDERENVVVHDSKRTFKDKAIVRGSEWEVCESFDAAYKSQANKICYSPSREELRDEAVRENLCEWILLRGNTTFAVDEGTKLCSVNNTPAALDDGWATGRESGLEIWIATQQPAFIDSLAYTQTTGFYIFYCALRAHRDKIGGFVPLHRDQIGSLKKRQLYFYQDDMREALGPYSLNPDTLRLEPVADGEPDGEPFEEPEEESDPAA